MEKTRALAFTSSRSLLVAALCGTLVVGSKALAGQPDRRDALTFAEQFVKATYPETLKEGWFCVIRMDMVSYNVPWTSYPLVSVALYNRDVPAAKAGTPDGALSATLQSDDHGQFKSVFVDGAFVHSRQNAAFSEQVEGNRSWSVERVKSELRLAGARFVDDQRQFLDVIPLRRWERLFGRLRVESFRLSVPRPGDDGGSRLAQLSTYWEAVLAASDGARYYVIIEPFGGAVTNLYRVKSNFQLSKESGE